MPSSTDPTHVQRWGRRARGIDPHIQKIMTDDSKKWRQDQEKATAYGEREGGMHWNSSRAQKLRPELMATEVKFRWARKETVLPCFPKCCAFGRHDSWTAGNGQIMWVLKIKEREERTGKEKSRKFKITIISDTMSSSIDGVRESVFLVWQ